MPVEIEIPKTKHAKSESLAMSTDEAAAVSRMVHELVAPESYALLERHEEFADADMKGKDPAATRAFMLFDDLADIYRDVHHGLAVWNVGTPDAQAEAAWQWRWGYENHWGEHLFRAMLTVHEMRYWLVEE